MMFFHHKRFFFLLALALIALGLGIYAYLGMPQGADVGQVPFNPPYESPQTPADNRAMLEGEFVCLPHTDTTGPQTEECAFGLKTADGKYYALDLGPLSQNTGG